MSINCTTLPNFLSFAESDLKGILGEEEMKMALHYKAYLFSSVIFINDNGKFKNKKNCR
jgi:hypothetical protein